LEELVGPKVQKTDDSQERTVTGDGIDHSDSAHNSEVLRQSSFWNQRRMKFDLATFEFCGKHIEAPEIALAILGDNWESTSMLSQLSPNDICRELATEPGFKRILRNDTAAEYDAENLCRYLEERSLTGDLSLTPAFKKFEKSWRRDEMNHAFGFAMLESLLFDISVDDIFRELRLGVPNFKVLADQGFFDDEFSTSVVIAYDEISTTRSYAEDYRMRYPKFKNGILLDWIKQVAIDERRHFTNIVNVIKTEHANRIPEIPELLSRILKWENSEHEYGRTFVLDHTGEQFTPNFINKSAEKFLQQFGFGLGDLRL
jgi:hypothetical protein